MPLDRLRLRHADLPDQSQIHPPLSPFSITAIAVKAQQKSRSALALRNYLRGAGIEGNVRRSQDW
jgi:hypothetical protein